MKRNKRLVILILCAASLLAGAVGAQATTRASDLILKVTAVLNLNKTGTFIIITQVSCEELGTVSYSLYKSNGTLVRSQTINDFGSGMKHKTSVNLANYIQSGNAYYVTANFIADGETRSITSEIRSY